MALFVLINEMRDHVVLFSIDGLFAGMMEVELRQLIRLVADRDGVSIARNIVLTNVVAGIDNLERSRTVLNMDRRQVRSRRVIDINGGLPFSGLADCEFWA